MTGETDILVTEHREVVGGDGEDAGGTEDSDIATERGRGLDALVMSKASRAFSDVTGPVFLIRDLGRSGLRAADKSRRANNTDDRHTSRAVPSHILPRRVKPPRSLAISLPIKTKTIVPAIESVPGPYFQPAWAWHP